MRLLFAIGGIEFLKYLNQRNCELKSAVQNWIATLKINCVGVAYRRHCFTDNLIISFA